MNTRKSLTLTAMAGTMMSAASALAGPPGICHAAEGWARPLQFHPSGDMGYAVGPQAGRPLIVDMNADGARDLVVPCGACCGDEHKEDGGHLAILLNDGHGNFALAGTPLKVGPTVLVVAAADFNEDGQMDLACGEHDAYRVTVLLGDGRGGLSKGKGSTFASRDGTRPHTHSIAAGDLNGDKHADLVIGNADDNTLAVWLGDGKGGFAPANGSPFRAARHPYEGLRLADMNGDGRLDAVVPDLRGEACSVVYGDGKGALAIPAGDKQVRVGKRPGFVCVGDINNDGKMDLVATHDDVGLIHVMLGDGRGEFTPAPGSPMSLPESVWGVELADIDGDKKPDLCVASARGSVLLLRGDGTGGFGATRLALPTGRLTTHVAVGDLDGDGWPDVVGSSYGTGRVNVWLQR